MSLAVARYVNQAELAEWRRRHTNRVSAAARRPETGEPGGEVASVPAARPVPPSVTYERMMQQVLSSAKKNRAQFQVAVQALRAAHPDVYRDYSDEQILRILEAEWDRKVRAAIAQVYPRLGRGRELSINLDGH